MAQITQQQLIDFINSKDGLTNATRADFKKFPNPSGSGTISVKDFSGLDFSNLNLLSALNDSNCNLRDCKFINTTMNNSNFGGTTGQNNDYTNSVFKYINASSPYPGISGFLSRCNFTNSLFLSCNFSGNFFQSSTFINSTLKDCNFSKTNFFGSAFDATCIIKDCNFNLVAFGTVANVSSEFAGTTFYNCSFIDATITAYFFNNTKFINCNFNDCRFPLLTSTQAQTATFDNCSFEQVVIGSNSSVTFNILPNCNTRKTLFF